MMVLISYDVNTEDFEGKKRLRKIAKKCESRAQRVQNSVFEADLAYGEFLQLKNDLICLMDDTKDSLRFYYLGNDWHRKIEHVGAKPSYDPEGDLII